MLHILQGNLDLVFGRISIADEEVLGTVELCEIMGRKTAMCERPMI